MFPLAPWAPHHCSIAVDLQRLLLGTSHLRKIVGGHKPHVARSVISQKQTCHNDSPSGKWLCIAWFFLSKTGKKFVGWPTKRLNPPCGHGEKHPHRGFPWQTLKGQQSSACLFFKKTTLMKNLQRKWFSSIKIQSFHQIHTQTRHSNKSRSISLASSRDWFFLMKTSPISCFPSIRPSQE